MFDFVVFCLFDLMVIQGNSALTISCDCQYIDMAVLLIASGAQVNTTHCNNYTSTLIYLLINSSSHSQKIILIRYHVMFRMVTLQ